MATLTWEPVPDSTAEVAVGEHWTYLITADARQVVLTRYAPCGLVVPALSETALNAIQLACPLPELQAGLRRHMQDAAQRYENGEDLEGQPAWRHAKEGAS
jgi:hypothetical protein